MKGAFARTHTHPPPSQFSLPHFYHYEAAVDESKEEEKGRGEIGGENEEYIMQCSHEKLKLQASSSDGAAPLSITSSKTGSAFSYSF